jgi:peptidoglycan/xylan/chitin deacetylase (PgdA/CDA1 family)/uncharacterized membrane protein YbhN (UPF0104 family)
MPLPKRLALAGALAATAVLLAGSAFLMVRGHLVAGALLLAATLAAVGTALEVFWVRFDVSTGSVRRGRRDAARVALTFDDGPGPDTPAVLDALDAAGAKATFFVLGRHAAERPDVVREIARRGHLVALHGHTHRKLHLAGPSAVAAEIEEGCAAIRAAGVEPAPYFRAPHGFKGPILGRALRRRGLTLVGWTRGVWDTERPGAAAIVERACARMRGGEILLLHDGCGTAGIDPRRDQTAAAVPEIVRRWRDAGFELVTVDALEPGKHAISGERLVRVAGLALVAGMAVFALRRLDLEALREAFAQARFAPLLAAVVCNMAALWAQSSRWLALAQPVAPRARPWDAFHSTVAGFAVGLVMPARAADVAKAHLLSRRSGASMAAIAGTLVLDHVMSVVSLIVFLGAFAAFAPLPDWASGAAKVSLAIALTAGVVLFMLRPKHGVPEATRGIRGLVARLRHGLLAAGQPKALAVSGVAALVGWVLEVAIGMFTLDAFGLPITVEAGVLIMLATTLSAAASISPGNAGAFELAVVLALGPLGIHSEPALAFAIGYHAVHLVPVAIVGGAFALQAGNKGGLVREVP